MFAVVVVVALLVGATTAFIPNGRIDFSITPKKRVIDFHPNAKSTAKTPVEKSKDFFQSRFPGKSLELSSMYETHHNHVHHGYFRQVINRLPCFNCWANINIKGDDILSFGSYFTDASAPSEPALSAVEALKRIAKYIGSSVSSQMTTTTTTDGVMVLSNSGVSIADVKPKLGYAQNEEGDAVHLVWEMVVKTDEDWWDCLVDAQTGVVMEMYSWVDDATYRVYKPPISDPDQGERELTEDGNHTSVLEWHDLGDNGGNYTVTIGNNVYAQENVDGTSSWLNNYRPDGGSALVFDYPVNFNQHPENYMDASITNLFYVNNIIHDLLYRYGFDEVSGNFQEDNLGRGGEEVDAVQANAQDGAGVNNANFATPVDGERPRMRMYLWNTEVPMIDGDFDNSIIMHEYGHGVSNRLTGGPQNVGCLGSGQSGGMGEGWSDWLGIWLMQKPFHTRSSSFPMGDYVIEGGIRDYPYDGLFLDESINEQTYNYAGQVGCRTSVHCQGSVWAQILWNVYWEFVDMDGWTSDFMDGQAGNNMIMLNVIDGMKLQPCRPTMCDARDAIIQADNISFGGSHYCALWRGFASRGLGVGQTTCADYENSFDLPSECS
jgi:extracellular elastinolytic metalloproteinase